MKVEKPLVAVYDTKSYDREYLSQAIGADALNWYFHEFRLEPQTLVVLQGLGRRSKLTPIGISVSTK